jgi:hypothetical protein
VKKQGFGKESDGTKTSQAKKMQKLSKQQAIEGKQVAGEKKSDIGKQATHHM